MPLSSEQYSAYCLQYPLCELAVEVVVDGLGDLQEGRGRLGLEVLAAELARSSVEETVGLREYSKGRCILIRSPARPHPTPG
jgi:hypothetical protein